MRRDSEGGRRRCVFLGFRTALRVLKKRAQVLFLTRILHLHTSQFFCTLVECKVSYRNSSVARRAHSNCTLVFEPIPPLATFKSKIAYQSILCERCTMSFKEGHLFGCAGAVTCLTLSCEFVPMCSINYY